jgi:uncharacterized membrane protein
MSNPIKPTIKTELLSLFLILISIIASLYFFSHFPERVPIHWNISGQPDNWGSPIIAAFLFPAIILGMYLLFLFMPLLDPKKERYDQFRNVYHIFKNILVAFMAIVYFATSLNALGYNIPIGVVVPIMVGLLFIVMGNYMSKIKSNWFVGIRTPWTLSSEEVWNKTHRWGGKLFIIAGLLMASEAFLPVAWRMPVFILVIALAVLGTIGGSYIIYLKEKKKNDNQ